MLDELAIVVVLNVVEKEEYYLRAFVTLMIFPDAYSCLYVHRLYESQTLEDSLSAEYAIGDSYYT
jgi:hypothetical protein